MPHLPKPPAALLSLAVPEEQEGYTEYLVLVTPDEIRYVGLYYVERGRPDSPSGPIPSGAARYILATLNDLIVYDFAARRLPELFTPYEPGDLSSRILHPVLLEFFTKVHQRIGPSADEIIEQIFVYAHQAILHRPFSESDLACAILDLLDKHPDYLETLMHDIFTGRTAAEHYEWLEQTARELLPQVCRGKDG